MTDGERVSISIANGKVLEGRLNMRQKELIKAWMLILVIKNNVNYSNLYIEVL